MTKLIIQFSFLLITALSLNAAEDFYSLTAKKIDGSTLKFKDLKGKKLMIVNTASNCSFTPQYADLQKLYDQFGGAEFEIIGFPANNFNGQEPGTNDDIEDFCRENYGVTFTMMEKISVSKYNYLSWPANPANSTPATKHPVYQWLTEKAKNGAADTEIQWNFYKFLINEDGTLFGVAPSNVSPLNTQIVNWIASSAPKITSNPMSKEVNVGGSLTLTVAATGTNLKYEWKKDNQYLSGKTSSTLTIPSVTSNDAGSYVCEVSNSLGKVTSTPAKITVKSAGEPVITLVSNEFNFGNVEVNKSKEQKIDALIKNTGTSNLVISDIPIVGNSSAFSVVGVTLPLTIAPNSTASVTFKCNPKSAGFKSSVATFTSNSSKDSPEFALKAFGAEVQVATDVNEVKFTATKLNEATMKKVIVKNNSNLELEFTQIIEGSNDSNFSLGSPSNFKLQSNKEIELSIDFTPTTNNDVTANLKLRVAEFGKVIDIPLYGSVNTTSVATNDDLKILEVFPNPALDRIYFSTTSDELNKIIEIYNTEAVCINKIDFQGQFINLDISKYSTGNYYYQLIGNN